MDLLEHRFWCGVEVDPEDMSTMVGSGAHEEPGATSHEHRSCLSSLPISLVEILCEF